MHVNEEKLKTEVMEALLMYLEGKMPFRSVVVLGMNVHSKAKLFKDEYFTSVLSQLDAMGNEIGNNKDFSREEIKETFTTMLEKLVK